MKRITIVDYGVGNLRSIERAFHHVGAEAVVSEDADDVRSADALVLPGVGSFEAGMRGLQLRGLVDTVRAYADSGKPILGICLGAQIMLSKGYEFGEHEGLGVIPGKVVPFPLLLPSAKIPHIGWNTVCAPAPRAWDGTVFGSLSGPDGFDAYFVHSFILEPNNPEHVFAVTEYGGLKFCSAVRKGAVLAVQFHPEKSGKAGIEIVRNFTALIR